MKASEIEKIIRACSGIKIKSLKIGEFQVEFYEESAWQPTVIRDNKKDSVNFTGDTDTTLKKLHSESILEEEIVLKDDQLAQLNLEDPLAFDEYMQRGGIDG